LLAFSTGVVVGEEIVELDGWLISIMQPMRLNIITTGHKKERLIFIVYSEYHYLGAIVRLKFSICQRSVSDKADLNPGICELKFAYASNFSPAAPPPEPAISLTNQLKL